MITKEEVRSHAMKMEMRVRLAEICCSRMRTYDLSLRIFTAFLTSGAFLSLFQSVGLEKYTKVLGGISALLSILTALMAFDKRKQAAAELVGLHSRLAREFKNLEDNFDSLKAEVVFERAKGLFPEMDRGTALATEFPTSDRRRERSMRAVEKARGYRK